MKYSIDDIRIFMLTHNRKEMAEKMLKSILCQTANINEVIVLDNNSVDGTDELFENYPDKRVKYVKTLGGDGSYLKLLELADKKYLCFFHDDDYIHPQYLERQVAILNKLEKEPAVLTSGYLDFTDDSEIDFGSDLAMSFFVPDDEKQFSKIVWSDVCRSCYPATIYKTEVYKKISVHQLMKKYGRLADYFIVCKAMEYGCGAILNDNKAYMHRIHKGMDSLDPSTKITDVQFQNLVNEINKQTDNFENISIMRKYEVLMNFYRHLHNNIDFYEYKGIQKLFNEAQIVKKVLQIRSDRYKNFISYLKYLFTIRFFKTFLIKRLYWTNEAKIKKNCRFVNLDKEALCEKSV